MSRTRSQGQTTTLVTVGLLAVVLGLVHLITGSLDALFDPLRYQTVDRLFRLRAHFESFVPRYDESVVHVVIDEESLEKSGEFYFGRAEHARLVRNLGRLGISAQLHDVIFGAPIDEAVDLELARATREAGSVFYGMALGLSRGTGLPEAVPKNAEYAAVLDRFRWHLDVDGDASAVPRSTGYHMTFPELAEAAEGLGPLDAVPDLDGVYRRVPMLIRDRDGYFPGMALLVLCHHLGVTPERVEFQPGRSITLHDASVPGEDVKREIVIPVDDQGRMIVNFLGPWGSMTTYPFFEIYEASEERFVLEMLREDLQNKIAVVSFISTGSGDVGAVPTDPLYPLPGLHANALNTILTGNFVRELSPVRMLLLVEIPLLALLLLASLRLSTVPFVAAAIGLTLGYLALATLAFLSGGWILDIPGPVMALLLATPIVAAYHFHVESRLRAVLRSTFDAYFPPSVVQKIMAHSEQLTSAAQKKELTILFSDIKSFTQHTSEMDAGHVRKLLNEYFEKMIEIVFHHGGTLDKFIGDGLMVFFGDPEDQPDHAARCVRAAIDMQHAAYELNRAWAARGDMPLEIRIGINTGEVVVGNMGSSRRLSYTVLGEAVNLAQRLESSAPVGGVLISHRTHELLGGTIPATPREPIRVKGFDQPIAVFEIPIDQV